MQLNLKKMVANPSLVVGLTLFYLDKIRNIIPYQFPKKKNLQSISSF
jgi:hypothetical protein